MYYLSKYKVPTKFNPFYNIIKSFFYAVTRNRGILTNKWTNHYVATLCPKPSQASKLCHSVTKSVIIKQIKNLHASRVKIINYKYISYHPPTRSVNKLNYKVCRVLAILPPTPPPHSHYLFLLCTRHHEHIMNKS